MTQNGQGGAPQPGGPWGPDQASGYPAYPEQQQAQQEQPQYPEQQAHQQQAHQQGQHQAPPGAAYGYPQAYPGPEAAPGHVVGPGYEGPGDPHGYGYPPLPEAATQYIPPVPAAPGHEEAATQYIPPVPATPGHEEAATQYIPPVPGAPADGFDGLFRGDDSAGHTQHLPPVQEPVLRRPQPRPHPQRPQQPQYQQQPPQPPYQQPHPQQQYAPPPPPPETGRKVSPAIIAAVVIGLAVVGLGVGSLLADDKPQNNDPGAVAAAPTASGGSAAPGGEAPVDPARPQAVQLDKLLADSNDSRAAVIKAVEDIKGCSNLDQAAADLRDAARQREELVTRLQELKLDQLPDHAKLSASLTKAWQSSADADDSYAAWADDVDDDKCKDGKAKSTKNASDGNRSSGEATKAKESAATMWNAIAGKYGLTKRDKSQL
ncbi:MULTISPECIES: hypothetical protein [unclassified Streptomyces]|uniref:hypothetical protein n=1 Tax=unclassified Streptomyces TaxID=2593676 RepID=UPI00068D69A4|nr:MULTISPECIES: hypothetical protein [unclassified Streptomyces]